MTDGHDSFHDAETGPIEPDRGEKSRGPEEGSGLSGAIVGDGSGAQPGPFEAEVPDRIGPYRIHGVIGRGGMGSVYKASHDSDPGRRLVALKIIRRGMDTEEILERFEVERQVLSGLGHPYIARFFEAGETDDGRPYFVMEYVEGQPISAYCDANNLPVGKRLELFRKVCEAVHHAHTNLIVHRDLKPDNIIVTPAGDPKLLDFGIAKLLNPSLAAAVAVTGPAMRLLTPEYASPEQVRGDPISTMSDVYSLGVLLYELLSGHRPYHIATRLEHEMVRIICETDPERPSASVNRTEAVRRRDGSTSEVDAQTIAQRRGGRPATLRRLLSGDLDDIIMHAMSKAPAERYPSAQDLSEDLGRYLMGEPVDARRARQRAMYVAKKFVRRHRVSVTATVTALIALASMGGVALWQYRSAVRAELATAAAELVAEREIAAAAVELSESRQNELIRGAFENALWSNLGNRLLDVKLSATDREKLWRSVMTDYQALRKRFGENHRVAMEECAKAYKEFGDTLGGRRTANMGDSEGALEFYTKSCEIYDTLSGSPTGDLESDEIILYRAAIANLYRGDLLRDFNKSARADEAYNKARDLLEQIDPEGERAFARRRGLMAVLLNHAQMAGRTCDFDRAIELCNASIEIRTDLLSNADADPELERTQRWLAIGQVNMGEILVGKGEADRAEEVFRRALATRRSILERLGPDKRRLRDIAVSSYALSGALAAQGRSDAALRALRESEEILVELIEAHSDDAANRVLLCGVLTSIGVSLMESDDPEGAVAAAEQAEAAASILEARAPGNSSIQSIRSEVVLLRGEALLDLELLDDARSDLEAGLRLTEALAADDAGRVSYQRQLARASIAMGDLELAVGSADGEPSEGARRESRAWYRRAAGIYDQLESEGRRCGVSDEQRADLARRLTE